MKRMTLGTAALLAAVFAVTSASVTAGEIEVTADDYAVAEGWLRPNMVKLVKNLQVSPHWIDDTDEFWYRRDTADGHDFVVVAAATGEKRAAFDHAAVAGALKEAGLEDVDPGDLPFASFSYDADRTAIVFTVMDEEAGPTGEYRCELGGDCSLVEHEPTFAVPEGALVSPNGGRCVISEGGNLFLFDLKTGAKSVLTTDGEEHFGYGLQYGNWQARYIPQARAGKRLPPMEAYWAPDSSHLLATRLDERHVEPYPFVVTAPHDGSFRPQLYQPRVPLVGEEPAKVDYFVFDTDTGRRVRLNLPYEELFHVHQDMLAIRKTWWSADGGTLWAVAWGLNLDGAYLYEVDTATGEYRTVIEEHMEPRTDTNSTSYNLPNVHVTADGAEAVWFSQRSGWGHLYLYDGKTGKLKNAITSGDWLVRDIIRVDETNRQIYFTGSGRGGSREDGNPYFRYLYRVGFDGSGLELLTPETADHLINAPNDVLIFALGAEGLFSPGGDFIAYNYSTIDQPTRFVVRKASNAKLVAEVERADATALYETGWTDPEPFVVKAADGTTDLYGIIYKPIGFDPEVRYPVVDSQYASPLTAVVPHNFAAGLFGVSALIQPTNLRALGFVCVAVDARGTTYRSREFSHYSWLNLNTIGLEDHVAAIRNLAADRTWMDLDRVGIHGGSYGGFTAVRAMLEFPDFFKVGVANAAPTVMSAMYPDYHWEAFHGKATYEDGSHRRPSPTSRPVNNANLDGVLQAENLKGDLLLMVGEIDENVFPASTLQMVDKLIELDKDFDMLYVPNRPHYFGSAFTVRRCWDYLVRHLHGQEPPEYHINARLR